MKPIDYVIIALLTIGLVGVVVYLIRQKKKGKSGCGCGCSGCPHADVCGSAKNTQEEEE